MQVAASQRVAPAHPPPVPPRPSRQMPIITSNNATNGINSNDLVTRKPRPAPPPCPTRQAPAPPINQRPWPKQHPQQQQLPRPRASSCGSRSASGRTVIYESIVHPQHPPIKTETTIALITPPPTKPRSELKVTPVNGVKPAVSNSTVDLIDDTSKRKAGDGCATPSNDDNNNHHSDSKENGDVSNGHKEEVKEESDANKKCRNKDLCVKFKDDEGVLDKDTSSASGLSSPECATVVVIEDREDPPEGCSPSECEGSPNLFDQKQQLDNIRTQDWLEAGVRYTSTKITLPAEKPDLNNQNQCYHPKQQPEFADLDFSSIIKRIAMSSLQGLPPLPRSLSGFNLNGAGLTGDSPVHVANSGITANNNPQASSRSSSRLQRGPKTPSTTSLSSGSQGSIRPSPQGRQLTTLDTQLAILRREMFGLRQLDLSLLSQLWSLNESIQEFRQLLQDQEERAPSPSPSMSDDNEDASSSYNGSSNGANSSSVGGSNNHPRQPLAPPTQQPPPPPRRIAPPAGYHHAPRPRSARSCSSRPPPSDESPSSEEYGPV